MILVVSLLHLVVPVCWPVAGQIPVLVGSMVLIIPGLVVPWLPSTDSVVLRVRRALSLRYRLSVVPGRVFASDPVCCGPTRLKVYPRHVDPRTSRVPGACRRWGFRSSCSASIFLLLAV